MLFFPICHEDHWSVFVVDIKDKKYVVLDSFFTATDEYQQILSEKMRSAFEYYWKKYIDIEMGFNEYEFIFPVVPQQPLDNTTDSGIYAMMFIEHWISPRTQLTTIFDSEWCCCVSICFPFCHHAGQERKIIVLLTKPSVFFLARSLWQQRELGKL